MTTRLWPWFLHGAALALLPWLHSRFALLAGSIGALVLLRLSSTKNPAGKAVAFLSVPAVERHRLDGLFRRDLWRRRSLGAIWHVREFSLGFIPGGLAGLLFDQRFGLIANAPVLAGRHRRAGDDAASCRESALLRQAPTASAGTRRSSPGDRAALRHGSVSADGDELRDVVGGMERAGAVCQSCGSHPRHSVRRCVAVASGTAGRGSSPPARWP